ncbi:MAG: DUF1778 domain-containing protein [Ilumatobacteraceae bacterium]
MHVQPVVNELAATLTNHGALASGDPAVETAISSLVEALGPALHIAALQLAQQAATEVGAQLDDRTVDIVMSDGDPSLRVSAARVGTSSSTAGEEFDARITLRLPPSLKSLIEDSATIDGDSVNAWVVDALSKRAKRPVDRGDRVTDSFDL